MGILFITIERVNLLLVLPLPQLPLQFYAKTCITLTDSSFWTNNILSLSPSISSSILSDGFSLGRQHPLYIMGDVAVENSLNVIPPHKRQTPFNIPSIDIEGIGNDDSDEYSTLKKLQRHLE